MHHQNIAISMAYPIMKTIVHKGFDRKLFCKYASFDENLLQDVESRITGKELERLMSAAADFTQDDHFGLHNGQVMDFADMGVLGYVMMHSRTVADALAAYQRYNKILCSGFNLSWELLGDDVLIRMFLGHEGSMSRHCAEDMASSVYRLIGNLSHRRIPLQKVQFMHAATPDVSPYLPVFGIVPEFGQEGNVLRMTKDVLDYPVMYSDSRLLEVFQSIAQDQLAQASLFSEQVVQWMKKCMPSFFPTLQQTAESFGMSARTIQNRLKEENMTYQDLSVRVRKEMAMGYLRRREYSIGDIAYVLHFSEPSAFQLAFKKWTGLTPGQYRAQSKF